MKEVKGTVPVEKELLSEIGGVQGALGGLKTVKASVEKACDELRKALILSLSAANSTTKEVAGYTSVAKKLNKETLLSSETDKDLKSFIKSATALRDALSTYEKLTD
jgi:hypothetical protein